MIGHGRLYLYENTAAGNVGLSLGNILAGFRTRVISGKLILVCDATVATRSIIFGLTDGTNYFGPTARSTNVTAGQTKNLTIIENFQIFSTGTTNDDGIVAMGPMWQGVQNGVIYEATVLNGVAGDSITGRFLLEEFVE